MASTTTTTTTEALILTTTNGSLELRRALLSGPQNDEVLVEMHATGICHTDLSCMDGVLSISTPAVLGHEGAGMVLATGFDVTDIAPGDKVLLSINHCQRCDNCTSGHPNYCAEGMPRNFGGRRLSDGSTPISLLDDDDDDDDDEAKKKTPCFGNFFGQSSFARHAIVNRSCIVKVAATSDTNTSPNLALFAPLGCGISTGVGSVLNTLNVKQGSSLAVFGTGSVGLAAVMAGKMRKARVIVTVDLNQARLELARKLGATHLVHVHGGSEDVDVVQQRVRQACPEGVAYAVDCTGNPKVIESMMDCLATRGRAAQVGIPTPDKTVPINILQHLLNGREYVGCAGGDCVPSEMLPFLMQQQEAGNFPLEDIVSYYDVKDYAQAFEDARSGKVVKAVLKWI
ncbi:hypothetical protein PV05_00111 [Exophiala xenobiotica]|uniref:Enoyl reductase (ER) domain-containing protein n=1 Tax=Exophiala xenobiotica TaxID=348802 RepID=A0A0D2EYT9_9EURO|nr:uncharacterized protein PV05_00111 [Exophiala xenobiotica]KIW59845.1 hypothetical protein PV05_00111 [Exophiala xenobiotica]